MDADTLTLYRCYDKEGALLYVGITNNLKRRQAEHRYGSGWWRDCAEVKHEQVPAADASTLEVLAMRTEAPLHNKKDAHQQGPVVWADEPWWSFRERPWPIP